MTTKDRIRHAVVAAAVALGLIAGGVATAVAQAKKPALPPPPKVSPEEFEKAKGIFFDRCAGCHGVLRKGATGPNLLPAKTRAYGTVVLKTFITNGTQGGMPDWGRQGVLSPAEIDLMARYLQQEPPVPPEMPLKQMRASWKLLVPPDKRPAKPQHDRDWQNFFSLTLRDAGQVAIIDGTTKEIVSIVQTGYAVHISRMSASGRYVYTIGRDGKATMIDLWMAKPDKVAEVKTCSEARSIDTSKYRGPLGDFYDRYAVIGCYWPPHFVILDGQTLEPTKIVSTRSYTADTAEYHPEPRVAAIVASHFKPQWIVNVKETGLVWLVDYSDIKNLKITEIEADLFLHDGGWDSSKRYFLVAANQRNKIAVIDAKEEKLVTLVDVGKIPHPGRGANWEDPKYGPVWATVHLGEGKITLIGTDPEKHPEHAWKAVRSVALLGGGSLFIKTHPRSAWIWADHALNSDPAIQRSLCVVSKKDPEAKPKCWEAATDGRAVHLEYNKAGDEVWVSIWNRKDKQSEVVVYDDRTLKEKARLRDPRLVTPTGKFNVYNTVRDIY
ncbi:MAG: nitrite reductase [Candidatus Rokubacteria bacterium RIFCSPHIGHO2_12_FULL_73_22]|nr:MAG: nitrite reductase [Candidatus Rokubacteria bacterium RIFCSPHIGHO2_02_FULL_73_26]OGL04428.1 MAG: nitrite reductase [Candidatus Rokubacteria bacterium RIFCSPHIGHO2_12_FULL_73_22]OGL12625.1 MAG: nitrite reductase [Candidatus Rokubacteria bacterium RIFCSPLOWO2_02_FULL_73_56]OGL30132.1 MAG: nitrite reductase [Candidatus Rokubacteria bacterium RIFCSPLOWO2_12_FULL_73_47]